MEKQRSFSVKSSKVLVFSLTISSSLVFFAFFAFWAFKITPPSHPQTHLDFNITAVAVAINPLTVQKLTGFSGNSSAVSAKGSVLIDAHLEKPDNASRNASGNLDFSALGDIQKDGGDSDVPDEEDSDALRALSENDDASGGQSIEKQVVVAKSEVMEEGREKVTPSQQEEGLISVESEAGSSGGCELTRGKWVYDESYPLYTKGSCPFIDEGFDCEGNGRPDKGYVNWRWQPQDCDFPRFNATNMLELIRGKRLVFVGDSINRNQWESMLCLLMGGVRDLKRVYETRGRKITKEKGNYSFRFVDYKCTVEFYVTHFLVHESKARLGKKRVQTLRIDTMDRGSSRWRRADILVFNTAHWWSHYKTKAGINYYQEGAQVLPQLDVSTAFRKALKTWASWVDRHINPAKTQVFFRSSAPSHFRGGQWNSGGHCREATRPLNTSSSNCYSEKNVMVEDVIRHMKTPVTLLNITGLSMYRIDGHPSIYGGRTGKGRSSNIQDCSHWCLPGVPDTWNELLYMHLQTKLHHTVQ
ncbi:PMR5N domain-containing protein [Psidium guajava]|nr:PMR5N domain-containing protein [Psidium guajava]